MNFLPGWSNRGKVGVPQPYKSFVIVNPFGLGDVLFSTPLLRNLKEKFLHTRIGYLCNRRASEVLKNNPLIDRIFIYERDEFEKIKKESKLAWFRAFRKLRDEISKEKFDVMIDLSLNSQYALFAWWAGIRNRIGLDYKGRGRFLTKRLVIEGFEEKHVVEYYLEVLSLINISPVQYHMEVYPADEDIKWADKFLKEMHIENTRIIGVAPCGGEAFGKEAGRKRWPEEKFAELIKKCIQTFNPVIFIFAGPKEKREVSHILELVGPHQNRCYEFTDCSLGKLIALIDKCTLIVSNDTGPLRIADARRKKIVAIFGPVDEKVYGPYPYETGRTVVIKKDLACRPCYRKFRLTDCSYDKKCLRDISVDEVFSAVKKLLKNCI